MHRLLLLLSLPLAVITVGQVVAAPPDGTDPTTTTAAAAPSTTAPSPTPSTTDPVADTTGAAGTLADSSSTTVAPEPVGDEEPGVPAFELPPVPPGGWPVVPMVFPVLGQVHLEDDWGACRGGTDCPRLHIGTDVIADRLQPLLAAEAGVISHLTLNHETAGWGLRLDGDSGWQYRYYHLNNDTPGTDDGLLPADFTFAPGLTEGSRVHAGQLVGWVGDSGNAEYSVPHLHFEIRRPITREPINPYLSLRWAIGTTGCSVAREGGEPWLAALGDQWALTTAGAWFLAAGDLYSATEAARVVGDDPARVVPACQWDSQYAADGTLVALPDLNPADDLDAFGVRRDNPFAPQPFDPVAIV